MPRLLFVVNDSFFFFPIVCRLPWLADAMEWLLGDRERLQAMGKAGRELAEREFDVRGVMEKHLEIYGKLLP